MVNLTTQWACQNRPKIERSEEVSGSACCATSAGFMACPFGYPAPSADRAAPGGTGMAHCSAKARCPTSGFRETFPGHDRLEGYETPRNLTKLGHLTGHSSL